MKKIFLDKRKAKNIDWLNTGQKMNGSNASPMKKNLLEEKKHWTRREVQRAAKEIFFQKGYYHATVEEIAGQAGVSKGTIYLYFKNKDDLYLSLMIPVLEEINRGLRGLREKLEREEFRSGHDFVRGFFEHYRGVYLYDPDGIRIIQVFQQGNLFAEMSPETRDELNRFARLNFDLAREILSRAMEKKLVVRANPVRLSDFFWAAFIGTVQLEESKLRATRKDHILGTLEFVFELIARALAPKG